ncbi:uncharacterized protein LOC128605176 [Ictalurus furcatus]|uniref:uncharacterized protein LOC128605176 n=1 Tax=Ictalurus furcatus TaxID=66913 RepID=UPI002350895F|nr:uncharacterized protein LOC128605176 [Ictalurus furcatus]
MSRPEGCSIGKPRSDPFCGRVSVTIQRQVKAAFPAPATVPLHDLKPREWIVIKDFCRTRWNKPRWLGPFQILFVTRSVVKVSQRAMWMHASNCRRVPEPSNELEKTGLQ